MIRKIKDYVDKNLDKILFIFSLMYMLFVGMLLTYNYDFSNDLNLIFGMDTKRVITDITQIYANHYRADVHPLFILFVQPIYMIINGIVLNKQLAIIIITSFVSSLSVLLINKILNNSGKNKKINIIISLIYLFSFSNIIFTATPETYNFSALSLLLLWYYYIHKKDKYNKYSNIILIVLGILSFSFTITNVSIFCIVLLLLLIEKKINIKKAIKICVLITIAATVLNVGQKIIWNNTPLYFKTSIKSEKNLYSSKDSIIKKSINVIKNDYLNPIISSNIHLEIDNGSTYNNKNYSLQFNNQGILKIMLLIIFYIFTGILYIKNFKRNKTINIGLTLSIAFNTILHLVYGNNESFLYSLHFLYLIILLFGINYQTEKNSTIKKSINIFLPIFLIVEVINNNYIFIKIISYVQKIIKSNYLLSHFGTLYTVLIEILILLTSIIIMLIIIHLIKNNKKENNKEKKIVLKISIFVLLLAFESIFILINSIEQNNRFIIFNINNNIEQFTPKNKQYFTDKSFKKYFNKELKSLEDYQNEIIELKKEYNSKNIENIVWSDTYYFGMANRRKMIYQNNKLIDLETKKIIKEFNVKEQFIIPNIYTVIIETKNGDYVKIYEDNEGIHYIKNDKEEFLDTNKVNLYDFSNQKYKNIKKELYGELLFNIKNKVIYPNIIVYDKPWYRDAALTCMVLKQTNNTNLIDEWVNNITEIYDMQNANVKEPDNLGELLFILSTQENRNEELIDRIEEEAERIANSNPNGYYIYGQTDFGNQYLYQNLWYKLGIESVGREFKFDLSIIPEDSYSKMAWWSDYKTSNNSGETMSEDYPYLTYAKYHKIKNGDIPLNISIYPMTWEKNASQAKYENYDKVDEIMHYENISQVHSWSTSELLLLLLDDTKDLK